MGRFRPLRSNGGVQVAVVMPIVFGVPAPDAVVDLDPPRRPAKKRKREAMPPEYVKGPGKPGQLNPHWRKSFPDDEEDADGRGKVVEGPPGYGEWRRVPGFWKILASDLGYIMTEGGVCVRSATVGDNHYLRVHCNGTPERVHLLVARAFHGRPEVDQLSVDHIDGSQMLPEERRKDNRAVNLKWATASEQRRNQGECKACSSGEPCLVWEVKGGKLKSKTTPYDMTRVENTMKRFPSKTAAAKALGLNNGTLSYVLNGTAKTVPGIDGKRYTGKWDPDHTKLPGEEWKVYWRSEKEKKAGALRISNFGRIQWGYPGRWGHMHYPQSSDGMRYLMVRIDGKPKCVHVLVGELFYKGSYPVDWAVWDHKDRDTQNNHILNIHPVTFEENSINTAHQRDFYLWPEDDPDDWVRCVSQNATSRAYGFDSSALNSVLHKRLNKRNGSVHKTVGGYRAAWCDEVD